MAPSLNPSPPPGTTAGDLAYPPPIAEPLTSSVPSPAHPPAGELGAVPDRSARSNRQPALPTTESAKETPRVIQQSRAGALSKKQNLFFAKCYCFSPPGPPHTRSSRLPSILQVHRAQEARMLHESGQPYCSGAGLEAKPALAHLERWPASSGGIQHASPSTPQPLNPVFPLYPLPLRLFLLRPWLRSVG